MGISFLTNTSALTAARWLERNSRTFEDAALKLSAGTELTRPSDATYAGFSRTLDTEAAVMSVAMRNTNDAIAHLNIADGALQEMMHVLIHMSELAQQGIGTVVGEAGRSRIQQEFDAWGSELERVARASAFNGIASFSSSRTNRVELQFQVGTTGDPSSLVAFVGAAAGLQAFGIGQESDLDITLEGSTQTEQVENSKKAFDGVKSAREKCAAELSLIGAASSQLTAALANLAVGREAVQSAASQIRDVDVAARAADLVRAKILREASAAVLAQANQQPSIALMLLA